MKFKQAIVGAFASIRRTTGVTVQYKRGNYSVELEVIPGSTEYLSEYRTGLTASQYIVRDYLFPADELILNHERVLPQEGDEIEEVVDGQTLTYRVVFPDGQDEQPYTFSDPYRTQLRVHTELVDDG